ncbi:Beta-xylanase [Mycena sanguinolenta]|uniref:Beta-xylanase n=1 Tax=Mycena sanguinolenta TaxID=230812 RepID=A0A8H6Y059_9AGAR|nr:Beta-xylanase [Mycena sanguinolenta]
MSFVEGRPALERIPSGLQLGIMLRISIGLASILTLVPEAISQAPLWGQCGGQGFTGPTTCVAGAACYYENQFFSNCFPVAKSTEGSNTVATTLGGKLYFGTGVHNYELNDPAYAAKLNNVSLFGQITPASLSWDATEPVQGVFTFDEADALVALAKKNGQLIRAPPCISPSQVPNWVNTLENSPSALFDIITHHCITLVREPLCWGSIEIISLLDAWDIVVDPFTSEGFTAPVGVSVASGVDPSYIDDILTAARAADPAAKLYVIASPANP